MLASKVSSLNLGRICSLAAKLVLMCGSMGKRGGSRIFDLYICFFLFFWLGKIFSLIIFLFLTEKCQINGLKQ